MAATVRGKIRRMLRHRQWLFGNLPLDLALLGYIAYITLAQVVLIPVRYEINDSGDIRN